jgi:hypothetical protein
MYGALRTPTSNCVVLLAQGDPCVVPYLKDNAHTAMRRRPPQIDVFGQVVFTDDSDGARTEEDNWYSKSLINVFNALYKALYNAPFGTA